MGRWELEDHNDQTLTRNTPLQSMLAEPERSQQTPAAETARIVYSRSKEQPPLIVHTQSGQIGVHVVSTLEHNNVTGCRDM